MFNIRWKLPPSKRWLAREREIRQEEQEYRRRLMREEQQRHERHVAQVTRETARSTRVSMASAIANLPQAIGANMEQWRESVVADLRSASNRWFAERRVPHLALFAQRAGDQAAQLRTANVIEPIKEAAEAYRRDLINKVAIEAQQLFIARITARTEQLVELFARQRAAAKTEALTDTLPLPFGTRFLLKGEHGCRVYVIEQAPGVRTTRVLGESYELAFPYVVFVVTVSEVNRIHFVNAFFRNGPLKSLEDELFAPALANIDEFGSVCQDKMTSTDSPAQAAEQAIQNFWGSNFNHHSTANLERNRVLNPRIATFDLWQRETKRDPKFITTMNWKQIQRGYTLQKCLTKAAAAIGSRVQALEPQDAARELIQNATVEVARDMKQAIADIAPQFTLDQAAEAALTAPVQAAWNECARELEASATAALTDLFRREPELPSIDQEAQRLKADLIRTLEQQLGWIGLEAPQAEGVTP